MFKFSLCSIYHGYIIIIITTKVTFSRCLVRGHNCVRKAILGTFFKLDFFVRLLLLATTLSLFIYLNVSNINMWNV